jgi:hypothetical protein
VNVARAVEIFAYLDRRLQFGCEPGAAVEIVVETGSSIQTKP